MSNRWPDCLESPTAQQMRDRSMPDFTDMCVGDKDEAIHLLSAALDLCIQMMSDNGLHLPHTIEKARKAQKFAEIRVHRKTFCEDPSRTHTLAPPAHVVGGDEKHAIALSKINDIRNSIIGCQTMNWSEHIYPLVAALEEAGIEGAGYPASRANVGTMLERTLAAENDAAVLRKALQEQVDACNADDCEMCHRHRSLLASAEVEG